MKPFPTILTALILIVSSFLLGKCSGPSTSPAQAQQKIDSLNATIANLEANLQVKANEAAAELAIIDSLKGLAPKLAYNYNRAKDRRPEINSDSLKSIEIFDQLAGSCDSLLANRDSTIAHHEIRDSALLKVISIQHEQIGLKDSIIVIQSESLVNKDMELKTANKKVRRNRIIAGISAGAASVLAILH